MLQKIKNLKPQKPKYPKIYEKAENWLYWCNKLTQQDWKEKIK